MTSGFLTSANNIADAYLKQTATDSIAATASLDEATKKKFGKEFEEAYDSLVATRMLNESLRQSYEASQNTSVDEHASRLGFSIDNRVIDMLHLQLTDYMNNKVNTAIENALNSIGDNKM